ncbi:MAG: 6-phosphogluconolactonase [Deltaproteobacteria bacterium]|nr:6-phosphogluconolactonase [Deltaproteobacteria bacterium]
MTNREIIKCRDAADLSRRAAEEFIGLAHRAVQSAGRFTVALSGGSTPKELYSQLAAPRYAARLEWSRVHLFWGDERCVPPDHPESNFRMVQETLLAKVQIPRENVHRMAGEKDPQVAAVEYEAELNSFFPISNMDWPRFDLILLGLGEDGHTASLFPGSEALDEDQHFVTVAYIEKFKTHRLTLTLSVLNQAARIVFLVSGSSKAQILEQLLRSDPKSQIFPAGRVNPAEGEVTWLVDAAAAANL